MTNCAVSDYYRFSSFHSDIEYLSPPNIFFKRLSVYSLSDTYDFVCMQWHDCMFCFSAEESDVIAKPIAVYGQRLVGKTRSRLS